MTEPRIPDEAVEAALAAQPVFAPTDPSRKLEVRIMLQAAHPALAQQVREDFARELLSEAALDAAIKDQMGEHWFDGLDADQLAGERREWADGFRAALSSASPNQASKVSPPGEDESIEPNTCSPPLEAEGGVQRLRRHGMGGQAGTLSLLLCE